MIMGILFALILAVVLYCLVSVDDQPEKDDEYFYKEK